MTESRAILTVSAGLLALLIMSALLPLLAPSDPLAMLPEQRLLPPGAAHWLGTDELGRDVLSRLMSAIPATVIISVVALVSSLVIGILLGSVAGYWYQRWPDRFVTWVADVLSATPFLVLIAGVLAIWGGGLVKAYAVLTLVMWTNSARQVRAEVAKTMRLDWVAADRVAGLSEANILFTKVLPKSLGPALVFALSYLPDIIALEAGLSFLGLGLQPPNPGLGKMIFDGINYIGSAWWMCIAPAAALAAIVTYIQLLGRRLV